MRTFDYVAPKTLDEAIRVLSDAKVRARPIAGGTDLLEQIDTGLKQPELLVDVKNIPELKRLEFKGDGLHIGAAATHTDVRLFGPVKQKYNALAQGCGVVGYLQIQNRATVGGNICNASPCADSVPALLIFDAKAVTIGPRGRREMPLYDFFKGPGETVLEKGELLLELLVPPPPPNSVSQYIRNVPDEKREITVASVACLLVMDSTGRTCKEARIALGAVSPVQTRAPSAEAVLKGKVITEALVKEAARKAVGHTRPITDERGTIEYRKALIEDLTRQVIARCLDSLTSSKAA